jgi:hypothetical protein
MLRGIRLGYPDAQMQYVRELSYPPILTPTQTQFRTLLTLILESPLPFCPLRFPQKHSVLLGTPPFLFGSVSGHYFWMSSLTIPCPFNILTLP